MPRDPRRRKADAVADAAERLGDARRLFVFTGSGMSAESGIPTFRGEDGLWAGARPEDVATPEAFARDPAHVWVWYRDRIATHKDAVPNAGHEALAAMEDVFDDVVVATQNVDDLHEKAGSSTVHHIHGTMMRNRCTECGARTGLDLAALDQLPPTCAPCGGLLRPDVVWFGETLPRDAWTASEAAATDADACLAVGSSHLVYPAASLPQVAKASGAVLVEVNPEPSGLTRLADSYVPERAGKALPRLVAALSR